MKKILLIIAAVIVVLIGCDICLTKIYTQNIPHRYASAEEGKALLLANTEYYARFSQLDIDLRMNRSGATLDELLEASASEMRDFSFIEKYFMDRRIAKMAKTLKKNAYELPSIDEIVYVKTDMAVEMGNSGYTHGTEIYLNSTSVMFSFLPGGASRYFDKLLWHELFHCLSRSDPEFRSQMYSLIHFTVAGSDFELPPCVIGKTISNPDVEHHDSYASFLIDGQEIDCFTAWIAQNDSDNTTALIPIDGTDAYYTPDQASNFDDVFGTNTDYVIDPEECMADNFSYAMLYGLEGPDGQGYPDPEIIQGIIDTVSR